MLKVDDKAAKAPKLTHALKTWKKMLDSENTGEITPEELDEWKAEFGS